MFPFLNVEIAVTTTYEDATLFSLNSHTLHYIKRTTVKP